MFDRPTAIVSRLRAPLLLAFAVAVAWCVVDIAVYRSGAHLHIAEPDSNTGAVVTTLLLLDQQYRPGARNIVVFGDSRVGEGFSATHAAAGDTRFNFINLAVPGSSPRTWWYFLREVDRRGYRFEAVLVGTLYRDPIGARRADWPLDPAHAAALLGVSDARSFPATFDAPDMRERARHAVLFPALALRQDTLALLQAPRARWEKIRHGRPGLLGALPGYGGRDEAMPALAFDADGHVRDWAAATPEQRSAIEGHFGAASPAPDIAAANDAFLGRWLGAMADLAAARGAQFITYPLPRGPYRNALGAEQPLPASLDALAQRPNVTVLPVDLLAELEAPEDFFDTLHANKPGRERTGDIVGARVRALLDAPPR